MRWLPRLSWNRWAACDDDGDFEGFDVELHWLDLLIQFGVGRRERRAPASQCDCQAFPSHCSNDCPLHGLDDGSEA